MWLGFEQAGCTTRKRRRYQWSQSRYPLGNGSKVLRARELYVEVVCMTRIRQSCYERKSFASFGGRLEATKRGKTMFHHCLTNMRDLFNYDFRYVIQGLYPMMMRALGSSCTRWKCQSSKLQIESLAKSHPNYSVIISTKFPLNTSPTFPYVPLRSPTVPHTFHHNPITPFKYSTISSPPNLLSP